MGRLTAVPRTPSTGRRSGSTGSATRVARGWHASGFSYYRPAIESAILAQLDDLARQSVGDLNQRPLLLYAGTGPTLPPSSAPTGTPSRPRRCVPGRHIAARNSDHRHALIAKRSSSDLRSVS